MRFYDCLRRREIEIGLDFICLYANTVKVCILLLAKSRRSRAMGPRGAVPAASPGKVGPERGQPERQKVTRGKR